MFFFPRPLIATTPYYFYSNSNRIQKFTITFHLIIIYTLAYIHADIHTSVSQFWLYCYQIVRMSLIIYTLHFFFLTVTVCCCCFFIATVLQYMWKVRLTLYSMFVPLILLPLVSLVSRFFFHFWNFSKNICILYRRIGCRFGTRYT